MLKKFLKFFAKYILVGILPSAMLSLAIKKLENAPHNASEHADEVLLNAALTSVVTVATLGASLSLVRWLVVSRGVESGPLILLVAWLAGIAVLLFTVLPAYWSWKRYGFHYGLLMIASTVLGIIVLGIILVSLLLFFGLGLKLLRT
ncbi:MAG: hypothetical protein Q7S09_04525 [bacterium]|nr:hypothetical protein [bacterium]